jgi:hypothetical protein
MEDNWEHKSEMMRCKTCMFFCNYRCRHSAPTLKGWPAVFPDDWCGAHKLDKDMMKKISGTDIRKAYPHHEAEDEVATDGVGLTYAECLR